MSILVLNMGLKSIRCIVFDPRGNKIAFTNKLLETRIKGDLVTQNPTEWWTKAIEVMKDVLYDKHIRDSVKYITVTASSSCLVPVDQEGDALYESIMVSDKRAAAESEYISGLPEFAEVRMRTGLGNDSYLMLSKILWFKNNEPYLFDRTYKFLSPNDFLIGKLTGEFVTDEFNAQKYHYDIKSSAYPTELLNAIGIPDNTLPKVTVPGGYIGNVSNNIKQELSISHEVEVYLSTYDAICAFIGSGPKGVGEACDVSGTVTSLRAFSKFEILDHENRIFNTPFNKIGMNIVGGSNNLGGGLIEWVKQCYYQNEKYPYEIMEMEARQSELGAHGLIFLPYLMGERAPVWDDDARAVFFGLERTHTRRDMTKSVFESAGFCIMSLIEIMEQLNVPVNRIRLSGGLTRINLISQIKADITGKEIVVVDEFETTALGAAIIVGIGNGTYNSIFEAAENLVRDRMIIIPDKDNHIKYKEIYNLFKETYITMKPLFKKRAALVKEIYLIREDKIENL